MATQSPVSLAHVEPWIPVFRVPFEPAVRGQQHIGIATSTHLRRIAGKAGPVLRPILQVVL